MDESSSAIAIVQRGVVGVITDVPAISRTKQSQRPGFRDSQL